MLIGAYIEPWPIFTKLNAVNDVLLPEYQFEISIWNMYVAIQMDDGGRIAYVV